MALVETVEASWRVIDLLRVLRHRHEDCAWVQNTLTSCSPIVLEECYQAVTACVDVELSKQSQHMCLREGFDQELDDLRAKWDDVEAILEQAAKHTLNGLPMIATLKTEVAHFLLDTRRNGLRDANAHIRLFVV